MNVSVLRFLTILTSTNVGLLRGIVINVVSILRRLLSLDLLASTRAIISNEGVRTNLRSARI